MFKKIIFITILFSNLFMLAQETYTVSGKMTPYENQKWVILYQVKGVKQVFKGNTKIDSLGVFTIKIPKYTKKGMYRLFYNMKQNLFVDFLFNNENIAVEFNPKDPENTTKYTTSEENKTYQDYLHSIIPLQRKADSLQGVFLQTKEVEKQEKISENYKQAIKSVYLEQEKFEDKSATMLGNFYITSSARKYPNKMFLDYKEYYNGIKSSFFDAIDFSNPQLLNSDFLIGRVNDYVFQLSTSEDIETNGKMRKKAIDDVLKKIGENTALKQQILTSLLYSSAQIQDALLVDYLVGLYRKLPINMQEEKILREANESVKTAVGRFAPDFSWYEGAKEMHFSTIDIADYYIVAFWSTLCSHCLKEMPLLHDYVKDNKDIKVIAIALENDEVNFFDQKEKLPSFINILGLKRWKNEIAVKYDIHATPNYFIVDNTSKQIIAKPQSLKELKASFVKVPANMETKRE